MIYVNKQKLTAHVYTMEAISDSCWFFVNKNIYSDFILSLISLKCKYILQKGKKEEKYHSLNAMIMNLSHIFGIKDLRGYRNTQR